MYGNSEKNRNRTLCMLGFLGLLIAQGKMSALSTHSAAQEAGQSEVTGSGVKAGTRFIAVSIGL